MISEDVKAQMREICGRYPQAQSGMLPCLHLVQNIEGYVTPEGMAAVSEVTGVKLDEVESVVTFYSMYRRHPLGKHVIKVCTSISCYLCGSDQLIEHLEHELGITRGQTTPDGEFTLQGVECLAACGMAPALQVNEDFVERVTPEIASDMLSRLRRGESVRGLSVGWQLSGADGCDDSSSSQDSVRAGVQGEKVD